MYKYKAQRPSPSSPPPSLPSSGATLTSSARANSPNQTNRSRYHRHPQNTIIISRHSPNPQHTKHQASLFLPWPAQRPPSEAPSSIRPLPLTHQPEYARNPNPTRYSTLLSQQNNRHTDTRTEMCRKYYAYHTACVHESAIREYCKDSRVSSRTGRRVPCKRYTTAMAGITEIYDGVCGSVCCRVSQLLWGSGGGCCCCPEGEKYRRRRRRGRSGGRCRDCSLRYWGDGGSGGSGGGVWVVNGQGRRSVEGRREVCSWCWGVEG